MPYINGCAFVNAGRINKGASLIVNAYADLHTRRINHYKICGGIGIYSCINPALVLINSCIGGQYPFVEITLVVKSNLRLIFDEMDFIL